MITVFKYSSYNWTHDTHQYFIPKNNILYLYNELEATSKGLMVSNLNGELDIKITSVKTVPKEVANVNPFHHNGMKTLTQIQLDENIVRQFIDVYRITKQLKEIPFQLTNFDISRQKNGLARTLADKKQFNEAIVLWNEAKMLDPTNSNFNWKLSITFSQLSDAENCANEIRELVAKDFKQKDAWKFTRDIFKNVRNEPTFVAMIRDITNNDMEIGNHMVETRNYLQRHNIGYHEVHHFDDFIDDLDY